jgi:large subunit ribosomal protein L25
MILLDLVSRTRFGKGDAKKLRKEGFIPCVISSSEFSSVSVSVQKKVVDKLVQNPAFFATVFEGEISIEGKNKKVKFLPKNVDFHPVSSGVLHIDFIHADKNTVVVDVPVKIVGADKCAGLKKGGKLNLVKYHVPLECDIKSIPEKVEINISNFGIGRSFFLSKLELPKGAKMAYDCLILSITGRGRKEKEEAEAAAVAATAPQPKAAAGK